MYAPIYTAYIHTEQNTPPFNMHDYQLWWMISQHGQPWFGLQWIGEKYGCYPWFSVNTLLRKCDTPSCDVDDCTYGFVYKHIRIPLQITYPPEVEWMWNSSWKGPNCNTQSSYKLHKISKNVTRDKENLHTHSSKQSYALQHNKTS
jgi:hypothetical protein